MNTSILAWSVLTYTTQTYLPSILFIAARAEPDLVIIYIRNL